MSKKNFNWMPILKTGTFTSKDGKQVSFDKAKLDQIIEKTDLSKEPQFVVEHPSFDKLGFGTISQLKRVGEYLFALPKEVNEKFKEAVNKGDLPGRSVSLNKNDLSLSSIGFLPPEIEPAVDGLGSYAFSTNATDSNLVIQFSGEEAHFAEIEDDKYEFAQYEISKWPFIAIKTLFRNVKNYLIDKEGQEKADQLMSEWQIEEVGNPPSVYEQKTNEVYSYSQNVQEDKMKIDLSKITDPDLKQAIESLQSDLAASRTELQNANQTISAAQLAENRREVLAFCESDEMRLRILPAEKEKFVSALLAAKGNSKLEFSSADNTKVEFSAYDFLKETFKQLPEKIELSEMAKNKNNTSNIVEYQKIGKQIAEAVK